MFSTVEPEKRRLRDSAMVKMLAIGGLIVVLLIPLSMLKSLVNERQSRSGQVAQEVAATWGSSQVLAGPVLTVPYVQHVKNEKGELVAVTSFARFLPQTLDVEGNVATERRSRGIFEAAVYHTDLRWKGLFARPDFDLWRIAPEDVLWDGAYFAVGVPDMRGITSGVELQWGSRTLQLAPGGGEMDLWASGLRALIPGLAESKPGEVYAFTFALGLNGSQSLSFLPFGKETRVALKSPWPSPSFTGTFLPVKRTVRGTGFEALWNVSWFGRSYPQQWRAEEAAEVADEQAINGSAFGVQLLVPVDAYQKTERSRKYGALFLLLTFLTFFLYEQFNPFSLHPVQYLLVGSALCLFYLLLLSISEHSPFGFAYLIAASATVLLIGGYSAAILRGAVRALLMTVVLGALYGYLYVLLQLEDYALLMGSVGLFVILALVMYLTRRIDWSGRPVTIQ
ncbi:MAG TPA: cell envelope integrity protein CreD [Thermoanaerobaculia bacterium]|nr:cell envelope integrity protein CreD [Thermoanaerobaculia bacterium]